MCRFQSQIGQAGNSLARISKGLSAEGLKVDLESRALGTPVSELPRLTWIWVYTTTINQVVEHPNTIVL